MKAEAEEEKKKLVKLWELAPPMVLLDRNSPAERRLQQEARVAYPQEKDEKERVFGEGEDLWDEEEEVEEEEEDDSPVVLDAEDEDEADEAADTVASAGFWGGRG